MLLVYSLLADPESVGDVVPGPTLRAGIVDLQGLEHLDKTA
jgi:hypothetical protein